MILHLPSTFFVLFFSAFGLFLTICFHLGTLSFTSDVYASSSDRFPDNSKLADHGEADIIYLIQAQSCLSEHYTSFIKLESRTRRDVVVLSWGKRCHDSSTNLGSVVYIHGKNTSWSSGRNLLYHLALQRNKSYLYYVFLDEDIEFIFTLNMTQDMGYKEGTKHPLEAFENFLLDYEPAVGLCNYCSRCGKLAENGSHYVPALCCSVRPATGNLPPILPVTISFDAAVNAFHTKAVRYLLPYRLDCEEISWWESQKYVILRSDILFRGQVIRYTPVTAINNEHSDYPQRPIDNWRNILLDVRKSMPEKYKNQSVFSNNLEVDMIPEISGNFLSTPLWNISIPGPKVPIKPYSHFHK